MSEREEKKYSYFSCPNDYFFELEEKYGDVLSIHNGRTICFWGYLSQVLRLLQDQGLPRLGTLLLAIIATNEDADEALELVQNIVNNIEEVRLSPSSPAFSFLRTLSQLPKAYRNGERRLQLFQTIFANSHNLISSKRAKSIVDGFKGFDSFVEVFAGSGAVSAKYAALADMKPLAILHERFPTVDSILKKMASLPDFGELPIELEDPIAPVGDPKSFIDQLLAAPETFHIGALVRRIWSGLSIPFHSAQPSVQPLGGVSDLSNKGTLDKLLISEYAHDDILFLSRLANGEALYINRETPPETNKLQRILLIDSSLQTWGTPRVLAYAIAVAIAHHPKTDIVCVAYAVGKTYDSVYLSSIDELINSLTILDTSLDAAQGITAFFKESLPAGRHEIFLLTSQDGMQQRAVQKVLSDYGQEIDYSIATTDEGTFTVYKKSGSGMKLLQKVTLPLATLWSNSPVTKASVLGDNAHSPRPVYPILFPYPTAIKKVLSTTDGYTFIVTNEHTLFRKAHTLPTWYDRGLVHLLSDIPSNCLYEIGLTTYGDYLFLYYVIGKKELHLHNLTTGTRASVLFDKRRLVNACPEFFFWHDHFLLIDGDGYWKCSLLYKDDIQDYVVEVEQKKNPLSVIVPVHEAYRARQITLSNTPQPAPSAGHSLKTMKRVAISQNGDLVINGHALTCFTPTDFRFSSLNPIAEFVAVTQRNKAIFRDDSTITLDRNGMLILESSNKSIDTVYLPGMLDMRLGMATQNYYSGANFFRPVHIADDQVLQEKEFYDRFIIPFIVQINLHATTA